MKLLTNLYIGFCYNSHLGKPNSGISQIDQTPNIIYMLPIKAHFRAWRKFENIHKSYKQSNPDFDVEIVDENNTALVALHLPLEAFTKHFPELKVSCLPKEAFSLISYYFNAPLSIT